MEKMMDLTTGEAVWIVKKIAGGNYLVEDRDCKTFVRTAAELISWG